VRGAAVALENMGVIAPDPDAYWESVLDRLVDSYCEREPGSQEWQTLSHLLRLAPRRLVTPLIPRLTAPLAPAGKITDHTRTKANQYWSVCEREAQRVGEEALLGSPPMLSRLLYDIAISPHETRAVTSYMLLSALPSLVPPVAEAIGAISELLGGQGIDDAVVATRAARRVGDSRWHVLPHRIRGWADTGYVGQRVAALMLAGDAGVTLAGSDSLIWPHCDGPIRPHFEGLMGVL
jgi:hypothetical protein